MLNLKPYSASLLALGGLLLMMMGLYFVFLRPSLLPEDLRYMKTTISAIDSSIPGLSVWLQKVFWVIGGYVFATGLLTLFISRTSFRKRGSGSFSIVAISGISSIGFMTIVNFLIDSDFKIILLAIAFSWIAALILYGLYK